MDGAKGGRGLRGRSGVCQSAKNPAGQLAHRLAALPLRERLEARGERLFRAHPIRTGHGYFSAGDGGKERHHHPADQAVSAGKGAAAGGARRRGHAASLCDDAVSLRACGAGNAGRRRPGNGALRAGGLPDAAVRGDGAGV